jgi:hypothetical protein
MLLTIALALAPHVATIPALPADQPLRWGRVGHRIVARIAAGRLSANARREVRALLGDQTLAEIAPWADEVRPERPETSNWHYVNIPVIDSVYRPGRHCADGCIIKATEAQLAILRDRSQSRERRAEALKFVVHFIGDLHQPLHSGDRGDRGGNDVTVWFNLRRTNLHSLWDSRLIEAFGKSEQELVTELEREARTRDIASITSGTIIDWTLESHNVSRDYIYAELPAWHFITQRYVDNAETIVREQLLRGGVRLASLLEQALCCSD